MMYSNNLAVAIKLHGKVLREVNKDQVYLPFGSEYTILIKNLSNRRAIVHVHTDGTDATDGSGLIVPAGKEIELERFIVNGNLASGNRFKFIERTEGIEQHRGIGIEDGLIRVEYQFEQITPTLTTWSPPQDYWTKRYGSTATPGTADRTYADVRWTSADIQGSTSCNTRGLLRSLGATSLGISANIAQASSTQGITAPGSVSDQQFSVGEWFPTELQRYSMVIRLLGETPAGKVHRPVTVKTKNKCSMCGHTNKANAKFCSECGAGLILV